ILARAVGDRRHEWRPEHLIRYLAAEWFKQCEFFRRWRPDRHHVRILERRVGAHISAVHDGLVGPLEIERTAERFAHPRVPEFLATGVYEPALCAGRGIVRQQFALDAAVVHRRKIIARVPESRGEFLAIQVAATGEAFEGNVAIAIEVKAHGTEIIAAAIDRK